MTPLWAARLDSYCSDPELLPLVDKTFALIQLPEDFSLVEFACGVGFFLKYIHKQFPKANLLGIDIRDFAFDLKAYDVLFKQQDMMLYMESKEGKESQWDMVVMFDTYRAWHDSDTDLFHTWLKGHTKYFLTDYSVLLTPPLPFLTIGTFHSHQHGHFNLLLWENKNETG